MKYAADLHIHSALSPCADNEMTPNNIVNMALVKGLDIIAVTDHNSGANLKAASTCAGKKGLLFVPGIEVETTEEVHLICLFSDLEGAMKMHDRIMDALPGIQNRVDIFGRQLIFDEYDQIIGEENRMLVTATKLTINEVFSLVQQFRGTVIPAHIDRPSYSIISNLGTVPEELALKYLEISRNCNQSELKNSNPELDIYKLIKSSDAHYLGDILERENIIEIENPDIQEIVGLLRF